MQTASLSEELAVSLDDIKQFRQLNSRCPGHPEYGHTSGVETTTGPLGQGIGNSVGMAIASRWLAARYNKPGFDLFNFNVYALCSDGDLMEGVGGEAASIAGHLRLSNLCWIYDDNTITIEGHTSLAFSEDVGKRFEGYGWNVVKVDDVNDLDSLRKAIKNFQETKDRPTLIIVRSVIAFGSPNKANTHGAHGAPLGEDEVRLTKAAYGWPENEKFFVPEEVREHFRAGIGARGEKLAQPMGRLYLQNIKKKYPGVGRRVGNDRAPRTAQGLGRRDSTVSRRCQGHGQPGFVGQGAQSDRQARAVAAGRIGRPGALDQHAAYFRAERAIFPPHNYAGRNFHFGIREHVMGSILQRHGLVRFEGLRRDIFRIFRLYASADTPGGDHETARVLCLHARFHRRGRRRPDA